MKQWICTFLILAQATCCYANKTPKADAHPPIHPVVVVGSGVGALTASIYLQRAGVNALVLEGPEPGGAIAQSPSVENWPGELAISGEKLIEQMRDQAISNGAKIVPQELVSIDLKKAPYALSVRDIYDHEKVETIYAKSIILAMGSSPKLLGVRGESGSSGYWTRGVYTCATCDGPLYKNKTVAVIGGGDTAILEADFLSKIAKKVYLIIRSNRFRTVEMRRLNALKNRENVEVIYNTKVAQIQGNGTRVTHLDLSTENTLPVDGVFIAIGANPNSKLLKGQLDLDKAGYVKLSLDQQTSTQGVFAIGDMVDPHYKQAVCAAGDGAKAAIQVEQYLSSPPPTLPAKDSATQLVHQTKTVANSAFEIKELQTPDEFYDQMGSHSKSLVVEFYSPYCGPCRQLAPFLEEAAQKLSNEFRFLKVDVTKFPDVAENYGVYSLPTVMIFDKSGKQLVKKSGLSSVKQELEKLQK